MSQVEVTQTEQTSAVGTIGKLLLDSVRLTAEQAEKVVKRQQEKRIRFGEAAVELGYIKPEDIQYALSRQFSYAYLQPGDGLVSDEIVAAYHPFSAYVEKLRTLRSELNQRWFKQGHKTLLLASDEQGSGCTELAANLAVVFAQLGERTLLIDADLRDSSQHLLFKIANKQGLTDLLADRADLGCIHKIHRLPGLSVLTAGTEAPNPQELLARPQFKLLLDELEQQYDVIIMDSPALEACVDAQVMAASIKGAVLVANRSNSRLNGLKAAVRQITNADASVIGCILNEV